MALTYEASAPSFNVSQFDFSGKYMAEANEPKEKQPGAPVVIATRKSNPTYRYARVAPEDFTDEDTVQLAVASEYPVQRRADEFDEQLGIAKKGEKYLEVLSHQPEHVDLARLNNRGAFLDEHKDKRHLGSVLKASLSDDGITRAVVKFDNASRLSRTRKKQMRSNDRPHISLGYAWTQYLGKEQLADGRMAHRFAWEGMEVSNVAVPADPTVGKNRSKGRATEECHCIDCGDLFERSQLNDEYICEDCAAAEDPDDEENERKTEAFKNRKALKADDFKFRFTRGAAKEETEISFSDVKSAVFAAADCDKRFKTKRDNGDLYSNFFIDDIELRGGDWVAIISVWGATYCELTTYEVEFEMEGETVTLGDATEVRAVVTYEVVERGTVDSGKITRAANNHPQQKNLTEQKPMALKTAAELATEAPEAVAQIRTETETRTRTTILNEQNSRSATIKARNDEIHALANDYVKTHGRRWNGKPGEVYVVGERVRALEMEACNAPADHDSAEVRREFKRKVNEVLEGSREPKNQEEVASLPNEVAKRCSLRNIYNAAIRAADKGDRQACFMVKDGAELEAHQEIHNRAKDFPGGADCLGQGIILPINMPSGIRGRGGRMTRDSLASDFTTAGALIAPEFIFPTIELLRNLPALSRAGMTILSGVMGNLVLPRQEAATTAQSLAEGAVLAEYDQVLGQIKMEPHRIGSNQKYSRLALLQTSPDFEAMVMHDHMAQIALWIDEMGVNGQGAGDQPTGILNQPGISSVVFGGSAANAYKNCIALETAIRSSNIYEPISFITTSKARGTLRVTPETLTGSTVISGATNAIWGSENGEETVIGRPAVDSQQVPNDVLVALVGRHLVMAQWGGLAVVLDTISQADQDKYKLSINTYIDFALRHAQAVARSADSVALLS